MLPLKVMLPKQTFRYAGLGGLIWCAQKALGLFYLHMRSSTVLSYVQYMQRLCTMAGFTA